MAKISSTTFKPKISQAGAGVGQSPLSEGLLNVRKKVITVDALTRHRIKRKEKQQALLRREQEKKRRTKAEDKLEKKPKEKDLKKKSIKIPGSSFLDKVQNFIGKIVLGFFATRLVDIANGEALSFLRPAAAAADFIIDFGGKIFDGLVTFLDKSYEMYDGLKTKVDDLFGQEGVTQLENFAASFKKVANYTLITAMAFAGFGETAAAAQKALTKKVVRPAAAAAIKGISKFVGKGAARVVLKGLKLASPVFKKIPIIGPLVNFLISYFVFKEPIGKAALRSVGASIFGALGAFAGTAIPIPGVGTALGGLLGQVVGDYAGGWLYDTFFAGKKPLISGESSEQRPSPGSTQGVTGASPVVGNLKGTKEEKWAAITAMAKKAGAKYPELVAAQFALESNWGTALSAPNNFFGIKATASEAATTSATQEVYGGVTVNTAGRFKNFATPQDAVNHLVTQWYKNFRGYTGVNNASSAEEAAELLRKYGYATDPRYAGKLKSLLGQYKNVTVVRPTPSSGTSTGGAKVTSGGSKLAGDLGRFMKKKGVVPGSIHRHPEHPPYSLTSGHSANSLHYQGRAIDLGAYSYEQGPILAAVREFNRMKGINSTELIHAGNDPRGGHDDHVHVAYRRGGVVPKDLYALLHKGEIVIDPDSAGPAKQMLLAINEANSYEGIVKAIREYAPYDALSQQTILVPQQSGSSQQMYGQEGGVAFLPVSGAIESNSPTDILYKGA